MKGSSTTLGSMTCAIDVAEQARQALARLEQTTQGAEALRDPAQGYLLMGMLGQAGRSLEGSMTHLAQWWQAQQSTRRLDVAQGPFADDPAAAVSTAITSLSAAVAACSELTSALERAQICTADIADLTDDRPARPRHTRVPRRHRL